MFELLAEYRIPKTYHDEIVQKYALRDHEWKIIYNQVQGTYELYHIKTDSSESNNLWDINKEKSKYYLEALNGYLETIDYSQENKEKESTIMGEEK